MTYRYRPGICAIVWRETPKGKEYLVLRRTQNWSGWELPKGGCLDNETEEQTLEREMLEEVGLKNPEHEKLFYTIQYLWPGPLEKDGHDWDGVRFTLYAVKHDNTPVSIDEREHDGFAWLAYDQARDRLTYEDQKEALKFYNFLKE